MNEKEAAARLSQRAIADDIRCPGTNHQKKDRKAELVKRDGTRRNSETGTGNSRNWRGAPCVNKFSIPGDSSNEGREKE